MDKVSLRIYPPLAERTGLWRGWGSLALEAEIREGERVGPFLHRLADKYGEGFREALFDAETGQIHHHIVVLVNGRPLRSLQGLETGLKDGDEVVFLPAYAGG